MQRAKARLVLLVGVAAGAALGAILLSQGDRRNDDVRPIPEYGDAVSGAPLESRVAALEQALAAERQARQWLEEEILYLGSELERIDNGAGDAGLETATVEPEADSAPAENSSARVRGVSRDMSRLVGAGFTTAEAEWILRRESELQMQALRDRYDAERRGETLDYFSSRDSAYDVLRAELGDEAYERYLVANRRSTSVTIGSVLESSPAQSAGLVAGDEIISYDGRRVFDLSDLTALTQEGDPGQAIVVDIVRGGQPMQVVIPRGPLGITGGRRFAR